MRTSSTGPYAAYLRVYEPLDAFAEPKRRAWESYLSSADVPDRTSGAVTEHRRALNNTMRRPPVLVPAEESDEAFVLAIEGVPLICPWQTRLRCWLALDELRRTLSETAAAVFASPSVLGQSLAELEQWRRAHPDEAPHIRMSSWYVPVRWFAAFGEEERVLRLGEQRELYYRTPMAAARRRVARALRVLRDTLDDGPLADGVEQLGRWLEEFHPRSYLELDYGGLVDLLDDDTLSRDQSVRDVSEGLAALMVRDSAGAVRAYERMMDRWRTLRGLERAS